MIQYYNTGGGPPDRRYARTYIPSRLAPGTAKKRIGPACQTCRRCRPHRHESTESSADVFGLEKPHTKRRTVFFFLFILSSVEDMSNLLNYISTAVWCTRGRVQIIIYYIHRHRQILKSYMTSNRTFHWIYYRLKKKKSTYIVHGIPQAENNSWMENDQNTSRCYVSNDFRKFSVRCSDISEKINNYSRWLASFIISNTADT